MKKYNSIQAYLKNTLSSREDMKDVILQSALELLGECAHNFNGDAHITEKVAEPLFFFNQILDEVE